MFWHVSVCLSVCLSTKGVPWSRGIPTLARGIYLGQEVSILARGPYLGRGYLP